MVGIGEGLFGTSGREDLGSTGELKRNRSHDQQLLVHKIRLGGLSLPGIRVPLLREILTPRAWATGAPTPSLRSTVLFGYSHGAGRIVILLREVSARVQHATVDGIG